MCRISNALMSLGAEADALTRHKACTIRGMSEADQAFHGADLIRKLTPHIDAVLAAVAYEAGIDGDEHETIVSDALDGELLYCLETKAEDGGESYDPIREHGTLNRAQQGI